MCLCDGALVDRDLLKYARGVPDGLSLSKRVPGNVMGNKVKDIDHITRNLLDAI